RSGPGPRTASFRTQSALRQGALRGAPDRRSPSLRRRCGRVIAKKTAARGSDGCLSCRSAVIQPGSVGFLHLAGLLGRLLDAAHVHERGFGQVVPFAVAEFLEAADRVVDLRELTGLTCE